MASTAESIGAIHGPGNQVLVLKKSGRPEVRDTKAHRGGGCDERSGVKL